MQWLRAAVPCVPIALTAHHFLGGVTIVRARSAENQEAHNDHIAQQQEQKQQEDKDKGRSGSFPQWPEAVAYESVSTRRCSFKRGDVVVMSEPGPSKQLITSRIIGLQGDWVTVPGRRDVESVPKGHCWVEVESVQQDACDSRLHGPLPLALIQGRVTYVVWPPNHWRKVPSEVSKGRVLLKRFHRD